MTFAHQKFRSPLRGTGLAYPASDFLAPQAAQQGLSACGVESGGRVAVAIPPRPVNASGFVVLASCCAACACKQAHCAQDAVVFVGANILPVATENSCARWGACTSH